jgi:IrrE N-terminal-like domain
VTTHLNEFRIEWEWEPAPSVKTPEHRATWARIEMTVGQEHVTLVEDRDSSSSRRSIYCPLYPLAEWIAYNWWLLQANSRPAIPLEVLRGGFDTWWNSDRDGVRRHCLRSAGDGFLWPNLLIVPEGSETLLRWSPDPTQSLGRGIRYLSHGYKFIASATVSRVLAGVVESVIARLHDQGIADVPLFDEWDTIQQADEDEVQFCLAAARLGLDPYSEAELFEEALVRAGQELSGALLEDFLNAVDPHKIDAGLNWLSAARKSVSESVGGQELLVQLREVVRGNGSSQGRLPWQVGWEQARHLREELHAAPGEPIDPSQYMISLTRASGDRRLQAMGGTGRNHRSPTVVMGDSVNQNARRFTLSRALWHFLVDDPVFLVTASYTDRQRVERAFAAELLAPAEGIQQRLSSGTLMEEELDEIAEHFGVSVKVIEHQIRNQRLVDAAPING